LFRSLCAEQRDERACYAAIHEGEDRALAKYRRDEDVEFQQAWIRGTCRPMGNRHVRKLLTSYLVWGYDHRHRTKQLSIIKYFIDP